VINGNLHGDVAIVRWGVMEILNR